MTAEPSLVTRIDVRQADNATYAALAEYADHVRAETQPDEPVIPLSDLIQSWHSIPSFVEPITWIARWPGEATIIAAADLVILHTPENQHLGQVNLSVRRDSRCRGIGHQLLALIAEAAASAGRSMLMTEASDRVPAGEAFARRIGAHMSMEMHTNQLVIAELHLDLLWQWLDRARELEQRYELLIWTGAYPEEEIGAVAMLFDVMNQAPHGDLGIEDQHYTPELLRQIEQSTFANGNQRWTMVVRERATGTLAGFTEVSWKPRRPDLLWQGNTGVLMAYRNQGLGRWLKAAMLQKVMTDLPQMRFVRTGNADVNAPMLKINTELGYQPYMSRSLWQIETATLQKYLSARTRSLAPTPLAPYHPAPLHDRSSAAG
jgi:mycothiol synthase